MLRKLLSKLLGSKKKQKAAKKSAPSKKTTRKPSAKKPVKKSSRPRSKKKPATSKKKPTAGPSPKDEIGRVVAFFRIPVVAVIKVSQGSLKVGDRIWIHGHTTDLKQTVASLQINHRPIQETRKGAEAGIQISARARRGDRIYRIST